MPLKRFRCSICGARARKELLQDDMFEKRMRWLWRHRKRKHPKAHRESVKKSKATRRRNLL